MAYAYIQNTENSNNTANANLSTSGTPMTVTAHNTLIAATSHGSTGTPTTFVSNLGSTFTYLGVAAFSGQTIRGWLCQDAAGGSDFFTGNADSSTTNIQGLIIAEYSGLVTSGGAIGFSGLGQTSPGAGTDTVFSGNIVVGTTPAALVGVCNNRSANGFPTIGSTPLTYNDRGNFWPNIGGGARGRWEDTRLSSNGTYQTTFNCNTHSGSVFVTFAVALAEIGALSGPSLMGQICL